MEDLLNKNIFDDNDLCKLSPDYFPSNVLLRMEMRRSMAKDTHKHGIPKPFYWRRKTIENPKDYVMNKEIVNLKNGYHNNNIRNKIILKHGSNPFKLKRLAQDNNLCLNNFDENLDIYLSKSPNPTGELLVKNTDDFKLNDKPKPYKTIKDTRKIKKIKGDDICDKYNENDEEEIVNLMRVECRYSDIKCNKIVEIDGIDGHSNCEVHTEKRIADNVDSGIVSRESSNEHIDDLQTLLIMMAISNKANDDQNTSPKSNNDVNADNIRMYNTHSENEEELGDISNILNIKPLRVQILDKETSILMKYVEKWKDFVNRRKEYLAQQRQAALDSFFDKLSQRKLNAEQSSESVQKSKLLVRDYSTYQHRYKVQKHIIALQKAKLDEQTRLIEQLKYDKIIEASKNSVEDMREQIRKTYFEIDRQLKPKIKCLTNELKIQEIEEPALVLHCLKVPQFLQRMEKRAREREEKHAMIRERRRQLEEERIRVKQQAELAKAEMDKEEKMRILVEHRERRKRERIEAIRRKQHVERLRALIVMADLHYERYLMIKYGIRPFKKLLAIKRDNMEKAKAHYAFQLKNHVFMHFLWHTEDMCIERHYKAEDFYRKKILRMVFEGWKKVQQEYIVKKQVAEDYYDLYVSQLVFRNFRRGVAISKKENELKHQKAVIYHNSNLLFKTFTCWRTLPALNALKREQDARKARWRDKVLLVVPDYLPPED